MLYMLDTNIVSYIIKGKSPAARTRLASLSHDELACISTITEAELLYGLSKSSGGEQRRRSLDWFLARLQIHAWGREAAAAYGSMRARQASLGQMLAPLDTQIAAHAIAIGALLVTNDKAFSQVSGLLGVENWATDI